MKLEKAFNFKWISNWQMIFMFHFQGGAILTAKVLRLQGYMTISNAA
jgi:hypothetical protein